MLWHKGPSMDLGHFLSTEKLEARVRQFLKWNSVGEVPNFPFTSFEELQIGATNGTYTLGIDYTTSNNFAWSLYGFLYSFFFLFFATAPLLAIISSIICAFYLKSYVLFLGVPIPFFAWLFSNPYNLFRSAMSLIAFVIAGIALVLLISGKVVPLIFCLLFVVPFYMNRFIYQLNKDKFRLVLLNSEPIFLYFYQHGKVGFKCNVTGNSFWI